MFALSLATLLQLHTYYFGVETRGIIGWIIIGLLAGWIAGHITRGRGFGCIVDIVLGLIGSFIGGWIFMRLGIPLWGFWGSLLGATVGAVVLVAAARLLAGGGRSS